jgi:hypothetical protein
MQISAFLKIFLLICVAQQQEIAECKKSCETFAIIPACFGYCAIIQYACHGRSFTELNLTLFSIQQEGVRERIGKRRRLFIFRVIDEVMCSE